MSATINVRYLNTAVYQYKVEYEKGGLPVTGINVTPIVADTATTVFFTPLSGSVSGLPLAIEVPVGVSCMYGVVTTFPATQANASTFTVAAEFSSSDSTTCAASVNPFNSSCGSWAWWIWILLLVFLLLLLLAVGFGTRYYYAPAAVPM
jgi:hypothetical protein